MLERLREKWQVNGWRLLLILLTFAIGGSLTGWLGRRIMALTGIENTVAYIIIYILVMSVVWPFMVMLVSIPFGQFSFFKKYLARIGKKMFGRKR